KVASFLLPGINWEEKFKLIPPSSEIKYEPASGRLIWSISTVPAGTTFEAVFQIGLIPSIIQVGQPAEFLKEAIFEAVDNFTKENIMLTQPKITSQTISDLPGTVQP
ncbi:MAG: hypothetical protein ACK4NX_03645, partial [Candidatus Paceibacteria bacterium]